MEHSNTQQDKPKCQKCKTFFANEAF